MKARWVITGCLGQLGRALAGELSAAGREVAAAGDLPELDIADRDGVARFLAGLAPPLVVVNTAAFTHVDSCEKPENRAPSGGRTRRAGLLAELCAERGFGLVHVSTDYVSPGTAGPYRRTLIPR
jgi:dTDP-4-dehydrorhamnose reductase